MSKKKLVRGWLYAACILRVPSPKKLVKNLEIDMHSSWINLRNIVFLNSSVVSTYAHVHMAELAHARELMENNTSRIRVAYGCGREQ